MKITTFFLSLYFYVSVCLLKRIFFQVENVLPNIDIKSQLLYKFYWRKKKSKQNENYCSQNRRYNHSLHSFFQKSATNEKLNDICCIEEKSIDAKIQSAIGHNAHAHTINSKWTKIILNKHSFTDMISTQFKMYPNSIAQKHFCIMTSYSQWQIIKWLFTTKDNIFFFFFFQVE